jgi:hypothetical protein
MQRFLLILSFLALTMACGSKDSASTPGPSPQPQPTPNPNSGSAAEFASTVKPILAKSCAGGSCHTSGAARDNIIKTDVNFLKSKAGQEIQEGEMPPPGSAQASAISGSDKSALLAFIAKYK